MSAWKLLVLFVTLMFGALTVYALIDVGYIGLFAYQMSSSAGWQVLVDLVLACTVLMVWMLMDARQRGRNAWPFVAITLVAGSFGPLLYLLTAPANPFGSRVGAA